MLRKIEAQTKNEFLIKKNVYIIGGGVYQVIDTYLLYYSMLKWTYSSIYCLIAYVISFYQLNYHF